MKPQKAFPYLKDQYIDKDVTTLFDWVSRLEYTEVNPNGVRVGQYSGEAVLLKSGGNYYVEVCVQAGSDTWLGVLLTATP